MQDGGQRSLQAAPDWFANPALLDQLLATWEWGSMPLAWRMVDDGLIHSLDRIFHEGYIYAIEWVVEYADELAQWWAGLSEQEQISVAASIQ